MMKAELKGIKELIESNTRLAAGLKKAVSDTVNTMAREAGKHARAGHARMDAGPGKTRYSDRTGNLTKSIIIGGMATPETPKAILTAGMQYAPYVEYGHVHTRASTSLYEIAKHGPSTSRRTKGYPFMEPARAAILPTFGAVLDKYLARLLKRWGGKL